MAVACAGERPRCLGDVVLARHGLRHVFVHVVDEARDEGLERGEQRQQLGVVHVQHVGSQGAQGPGDRDDVEEPGTAAALRQRREEHAVRVAATPGARRQVHDRVPGLGERATLALVDARVVGLVDHGEVDDADHDVASRQRATTSPARPHQAPCSSAWSTQMPVDRVVAARDAPIEAVVVPEQADRAPAAQGAGEHRGGGALGVGRRQSTVVRLLQGAVHDGKGKLDQVEGPFVGERVRMERERAAAAEALVLGEGQRRVVVEPCRLEIRQRLVIEGAQVVVADAGHGVAGALLQVVAVARERLGAPGGRRRCRAGRPRARRRARGSGPRGCAAGRSPAGCRPACAYGGR